MLRYRHSTSPEEEPTARMRWEGEGDQATELRDWEEEEGEE